jgi:hypothetical protein
MVRETIAGGCDDRIRKSAGMYCQRRATGSAYHWNCAREQFPGCFYSAGYCTTRTPRPRLVFVFDEHEPGTPTYGRPCGNSRTNTAPAVPPESPEHPELCPLCLCAEGRTRGRAGDTLTGRSRLDYMYCMIMIHDRRVLCSPLVHHHVAHSSVLLTPLLNSPPQPSIDHPHSDDEHGVDRRLSPIVIWGQLQ